MRLPLNILLSVGILIAAAMPVFAMARPPHGAPGPIVGAGLPMLALGYGAYALFRRYRQTRR